MQVTVAMMTTREQYTAVFLVSLMLLSNGRQLVRI